MRQVVVVGVVLLAGCSAGVGPRVSPPGPPVRPEPPLATVVPGLRDPKPVPWQSARVAGDGVDVSYLGGAPECVALADVRVAEAAGAVTVTVYLGDRPDHPPACDLVGVPARVHVPLHGPLAGRRLLDGSVTPPAERPVRR